jgi:hypothetical protein
VRFREARHRCPTCEAGPGWPCIGEAGEPLIGTYHDLDEEAAAAFRPWPGWLVCLRCLDLHREAALDAHDHCACARYDVLAPDHVEARLPTHSLCVVCATGVAGGPTRWAVLACRDCLAMNTRVARVLGLSHTGLPLGRHSIMNGTAIRVTDAHDPAQAERLVAALHRMGSIQEQGRARARALADRHFGDRRDRIPLFHWQEATPPGPQTSLAALLDLLGDDPPDRFREAIARLADDWRLHEGDAMDEVELEQ